MNRLAGKVILLFGWRRTLVAFAVGALATLAQPPFDFFAVCFVSFPVLVWLLDGATPDPGATLIGRFGPAFRIGWLFGFGYFVAGLWWVGNAILVESKSNAWALPLAVLALPALLAVFYGFAAALARLLWGNGAGRIAALAFAFGIGEWLRATVLSGFPWNAVAYAAMPIPLLMQSVSLIGIFGMNAVAVFVFAAPATLGDQKPSRFVLVLAAVLAAAHAGYGAWCLARPPASSRTLQARLVQPSIDQSEKWDHAVRDRIFKELLDYTRQPPAAGAPPPSLIVWPETSIPFLLTQRPDALTALGDTLATGQTLLAGAVRVEGEASDARYTNSVIAINDAGEVADAVDKLHLVPFGEYLPFESVLNSLGLQKIVDMPGPFVAGSERHPIRLAGGARALTFICYEVIFPGVGLDEAAKSDLIVNVTNDAWFGDTPGPYQHFRQAQLRAVELGLPMLRAANNGISAAVDAQGRVLDALKLDARGVLDIALPLGRSRNPSLGNPETNGLLFVLAFAVIAAGMNFRARRRIN